MKIQSAIIFLIIPLFSSCASLSPKQEEPIPPLNPKGEVYKGEGENDFSIYGSTVGDKKIIILYLDFPDLPQTMTSEERGKKILGDGIFRDIFETQSYGKVSLDIEHVYGWRRLSKNVKQYSSKTTESHRDLFVEIFSLYPEIDFRQYDYAVANMQRIGNTAFGERDEIAIPYKGGKINVALNISTQSPYVLAHETGHLFGLPDLYTYANVEGAKNPTGPWDIMSSSRSSTGFIGWHRHKLKWLDADRKLYLTEGTHSLKLSALSARSGTSLIAIPVGDPMSPSKVFVIEVAQAIKLKQGKNVKAGGILIYSVDATLATGQNPLVVYPNKDLQNAAFHPGESFDHQDAPMSVRILEQHRDGSYRIEVKLK